MFTNENLKRLILPLVVEQILAVTIGMSDTIMVSSVGEAAVSGLSLVDTINILLIKYLCRTGYRRRCCLQSVSRWSRPRSGMCVGKAADCFNRYFCCYHHGNRSDWLYGNPAAGLYGCGAGSHVECRDLF